MRKRRAGGGAGRYSWLGNMEYSSAVYSSGIQSQFYALAPFVLTELAGSLARIHTSGYQDFG